MRVAVAGQRLVDGVVDDLVDQVVQAALAGGADVHAGALADRVETLEDGDRAGVVGHGWVALLLPGCPAGRWCAVGAGGVVPALVDRSGPVRTRSGSPVELAFILP